MHATLDREPRVAVSASSPAAIAPPRGGAVGGRRTTGGSSGGAGHSQSGGSLGISRLGSVLAASHLERIRAPVEEGHSRYDRKDDMAETIGVFGAGALGTLLATRLQRAGHAVHVLARSPARQDALKHEGSPLHLVERPDELKPAAIVFLCVKSYDTAAAARAIAAAGVQAGIASLQNGWGNMEILEAALPRSPLIAGATALGAYLDDSGALHASTRGATRFAPWRSTEFRWAEYAATLFAGAGLQADASRDASGTLWRKLALNAAVNPLSALSGRPNGTLLESGPLLRVAEAAAREAARVGVRLGYVEPDFDPVLLLRALLEDTSENRSSMAEDLEHGRQTEVDAIVGSVVRAGRSVGEPVPVLEGIRALIQAAETGAAPAPAP